MREFLYALLSLLIVAASPSLAQDDFAVPPAPHIEDYFKPGIAPVRADRKADVTIIYFMDYQCPACRAHSPDVSAVLASDRRLKVIYRDTPIFGPLSVEAAKYAIASQYQGKHEAFHRALMTQTLPLDAAALKAAAAKAGIDWARLEKDRAAHEKAIDAQIAQNQNLSEAAGISGTPAFIIGNTLANGALDAKGLREEIADARAANPKVARSDPPKMKGAEAKIDVEEGSTNGMVLDKEDAMAAEPTTLELAPAFTPAKLAPAAPTEGNPSWYLPAALAALTAGMAALALLLRRRRRPR